MANKMAPARVWLYLKRLYFMSSGIAYCISPYTSFYAGLSCCDLLISHAKSWSCKNDKITISAVISTLSYRSRCFLSDVPNGKSFIRPTGRGLDRVVDDRIHRWSTVLYHISTLIVVPPLVQALRSLPVLRRFLRSLLLRRQHRRRRTLRKAAVWVPKGHVRKIHETRWTACLHAYMTICIHAKKCTSLHAYMPTCQQAYMPTCLHDYMPTCLHDYMPTSLHAYMTTCLHANKPTCLHAYIHS